MVLNSSAKKALVSIALAFALASCGGSKKESTAPLPEPLPPAGRKSGDGTEEKGRSNDQPVALALGQEVEAKGDVVKDENDLFSLTRVYNFTLDKPLTLQIRKSYANGNCGKPSAAFIIMRGNEQIADVTFDRNKDYSGVPVEIYPDALSPGDYSLVVFITLAEECKNKMFYYNFVLEEAPSHVAPSRF